MEALILAPADCEVRTVIKFLDAQSIAPIEIHRQLCQQSFPAGHRSRGQPIRGGPPVMGLVKGKQCLIAKNRNVMEKLHTSWNWMDSLVQPRQMNKDMISGTWNVRSLYRTGAVTSVVQELAKY